MDVSKLQSKASYGFDKAATVAGLTVNLLRPTTNVMPVVSPETPQIKCLFDSSSSFSGLSPLSWDHKFVYAAVNTQEINVGDYLAINNSENIPNLQNDIYFVARFEPWRPLLLVQTNTPISFFESDISSNNNNFGYRTAEGPVWKNDQLIASSWQVSMLQQGTSNRSSFHLGTDLPIGRWSILMPNIPDIRLKHGIRIRDDKNKNYHIDSVELTSFGLHITAIMDEV